MSSCSAFDFSGKVAFVSGAASGIGQATAIAFAQAGAWVAASDINDDGGLRTVHMIQSSGGEAIFFKCDMGSPLAISNMMSDVFKNMGRIDCAFNNAGIEGESAMTGDCSELNWQRTLDINLRAAWLCMKYQLGEMSKNLGGSIVNCSSIAGLVGFMNSPAYVASKHGMIGLTKTAALEYAIKNIRVNAVCPGIIQTPMVDRSIHGDSSQFKNLIDNIPMGRLGHAEEIASVVLWLSSEQASYVTGQSVAIDGGWTAQ